MVPKPEITNSGADTMRSFVSASYTAAPQSLLLDSYVIDVGVNFRDVNIRHPLVVYE